MLTLGWHESEVISGRTGEVGNTARLVYNGDIVILPIVGNGRVLLVVVLRMTDGDPVCHKSLAPLSFLPLSHPLHSPLHALLSCPLFIRRVRVFTQTLS